MDEAGVQSIGHRGVGRTHASFRRIRSKRSGALIIGSWPAASSMKLQPGSLLARARDESMVVSCGAVQLMNVLGIEAMRAESKSIGMS